MSRAPDYEAVLPCSRTPKCNTGHLVRAWRRRSFIEVFVYGGETAEPADLIGEWEMPKGLGIELAAQTAERQSR